MKNLIQKKHYINKNERYTFVSRHGKDCHIWFEIIDYWGDVEFISAKHKISLNQYRLFVILKFIQYNGARI